MKNSDYVLRFEFLSGVSQANKTNSYSSFFILHSSFQRFFISNEVFGCAKLRKKGGKSLFFRFLFGKTEKKPYLCTRNCQKTSPDVGIGRQVGLKHRC